MLLVRSHHNLAAVSALGTSMAQEVITGALAGDISIGSRLELRFATITIELTGSRLNNISIRIDSPLEATLK